MSMRSAKYALALLLRDYCTLLQAEYGVVLAPLAD